MKKKIAILALLLLCLGACSSKSTDGAKPESASQEQKVEVRALPELAAEDVRMHVTEKGAVVDFVCDAGEDSGSITATRVDKDTPEQLFKCEAEFSRIAEKPCDHIVFDDINFDGFMDVLTPFSFGMHNSYYMAWVWDDKAQNFVKVPEFETLGNPMVSAEKKAVMTAEHISAAEHAAAQWQVKGSTLTLVHRVELAPSEGNPEIFKKTETIMEADGPKVHVTEHTAEEVAGKDLLEL